MLVFSYIDLIGRQAATSDQALVWRGVWSVSTAYSPGEWVTYLGDNYVCLATTTGAVPTSSPASWSFLMQHSLVGLTQGPSVVTVTASPKTWTNSQLLDVKTLVAGGTVVTVNGTVVFQGTSQGTNLGMVMAIYGNV